MNKIFGWLLFFLPIPIFIFFDWKWGVLAYNLIFTLYTYLLYKGNFFKEESKAYIILIAPVIFGFLGTFVVMLKYYKEPETSKKTIPRSPPFIHDYDYALMGDNGLFSIEEDVLKKHNLTKIKHEELIFPYLEKLQRGEIELYKLVEIENDLGNFQFKYDVTLLNPEDHIILKSKLGFDWVYNSSGLFRLSEKYFRSILELYLHGDESLSYELFYESYMEGEIDGEQWNTTDVHDFEILINNLFKESHFPVWISEPYDMSYRPKKAIFPIVVKEIGYVKSCGFNLYYKTLND